ncbi:class I SAM-dependent methyltransferase [Candidatus Pseudomonas adelgestsugas]|uniref:SAM-dependent methyltransferase n=1 Tax=Candidatus Pseudomonas adelgestsugas TaxID=1302376 RepID=A0ABX5R8X8_9PSED|nr:methyltransferase domain-containing protein [Candidatus Pseudomonas adelgestsugas]QAX81824.1 SAM-dependent methyltransferase [Candidatus Pseudomonas adelgestsugas]
MTDKAFAQVNPEWLALISAAHEWLAGPIGKFLLDEERRMLEDELSRFFGSYLVHYGPSSQTLPVTAQVQHNVYLGAPLPGVEIVCEEQAWPLRENAADVVLLQHGLDFCISPHGLLREAASSVRPGGHLLIIGINPWSSWGLRHLFAHDGMRQARCISPSRVGDWLNLLNFALEKCRFGCYRPPLESTKWQYRLVGWERRLSVWQLCGGGFYLLVARKIGGGLRPVHQVLRQPIANLVPILMPIPKVNRKQNLL